MIMHDFGGQGRKVEAYLRRLYDRRIHWAWPWVRTHFTAGIQSTQRVEKTHNIIKCSIGKTTPLKDLFNVIERRISDERSTAEYFHYKEVIEAGREQFDFAASVFTDVNEVNKRFLAHFALYQMKKEMAQSLFYRSQDHARQSISVEDQLEKPSNDGAVNISIVKQATISTSLTPHTFIS